MADNIYTHSNVQFFVSPNAQNSDLPLSGYKAITGWIEVAPVGSLPERGISTNMLSYDTVNTLVSKKAKGITDAGTGTLECARNGTDPGQIKLAQLGQPSYFHSHAFKMVKQDGTVEYGRGLVSGPAYPGGRNEDFDIANYTIAFQQAMIEDASPSLPTSYTVTVTDTLAFTLALGGVSSAAISDVETAANIKTALEAAWTGVTATVSAPGPGPFTLTLTGTVTGTVTGIGATVVAN